MSVLIIETRSLPATDTEQGRIRASSPGRSETVTLPYSYNADSPHLEVAAALLAILSPAADPRQLRYSNSTARGFRFWISV